MQVRRGGGNEVASFLAARDADRVARRGELVDALAHPHLVAHTPTGARRRPDLRDRRRRSARCSRCTPRERHSGAGTALLEAIERVARDAGCTRLWLITTNDNVDALRFYQRRGFRLARCTPAPSTTPARA